MGQHYVCRCINQIYCLYPPGVTECSAWYQPDPGMNSQGFSCLFSFKSFPRPFKKLKARMQIPPLGRKKGCSSLPGNESFLKVKIILSRADESFFSTSFQLDKVVISQAQRVRKKKFQGDGKPPESALGCGFSWFSMNCEEKAPHASQPSLEPWLSHTCDLGPDHGHATTHSNFEQIPPKVQLSIKKGLLRQVRPDFLIF